MTSKITLSIFAILLVLEVVLAVNSVPGRRGDDSELGDIDSMVQEIEENAKSNPITFTPLDRKLLMMRLQQEVKRSWRQCTFNAVSCFG